MARPHHPGRSPSGHTVRYFISRRLYLGIFLLLACGGLSSCNKPPPPPLRIFSPFPKEILETRLREFTEQHQIEVQLLCVDPDKTPNGEFDNLSLRKMTPDVCIVKDEDIGDWLSLQRLRDLRPFHPHLDPFLAEFLSPFTRFNKIHAIPLGWSTWVLYFNRDIFERHGHPFPQSSWDWGDLKMASDALTVYDAESQEIRQYGLLLTTNPEHWLPFLWQNHGQLLNSSQIWALTDPRFIQSNTETLDFLRDLFPPPSSSPLSSPPHFSMTLTEAEQQFVEGKVAMLFASRELGFRLVQHPNFRWDVETLPPSRVAATLVHSFGLGMTPTCSHPENAWKLISFLSNETEGAALTQRGYLLPARKDLVDSKLLLDFPGPRAIQNHVFLDSLRVAQRLPSVSRWRDAKLSLSEEFARYLTETNASPRTVVETMQLRLEELHLLSSSRNSRKTRPTLSPKLR